MLAVEVANGGQSVAYTSLLAASRPTGWGLQGEVRLIVSYTRQDKGSSRGELPEAEW